MQKYRTKRLINAISQDNNKISFKNKYTNEAKVEDKKVLYKKYADSFVKNAKETAPMFLALTSVITVLDYGKKQVDMKKLLKKNLIKYFAPVLISSSLLCSYIENRKKKV